MTRAGVGLAVVGLGFMGRRYAGFINRLEGVRLAGVHDINAALAAETADALGTEVFADVAALAANPGVEGIVIATPEHLHVAPAVAALEAGKAVLIEKPIAHTLEAAREIAAAARHGVPAMVGHLLRFEPRWIAASQRLAAGSIGEITSITTRRIGNVLDQDVLKGRTSIPLYYGVHDLDVMRWFAGADATSIYAQRRSGMLRGHGYEIDDIYTAVLTFENNILGTAELGWHTPANALASRTSGVVIYGAEGMIRIEQAESGFEHWSAEGLERALDTTFWLDAYGLPGGALGLEIRHFAACIREGAAPAIGLADATEALRLSLAMEASAVSGQPVDLREFGQP